MNFIDFVLMTYLFSFVLKAGHTRVFPDVFRTFDLCVLSFGNWPISTRVVSITAFILFCSFVENVWALVLIGSLCLLTTSVLLMAFKLIWIESRKGPIRLLGLLLECFSELVLNPGWLPYNLVHITTVLFT